MVARVRGVKRRERGVDLWCRRQNGEHGRRGVQDVKSLSASTDRSLPGPQFVHFVFEKSSVSSSVRTCLSHCICKLVAAPFLLLSVPCGWQGYCCPDRRGSLTKLASWRCLAKTRTPNKVSVVDCRFGTMCRHVPCGSQTLETRVGRCGL